MGFFRLALAISVLLGHSGGHGFFGLGFLDRQVAVQCFFIISGFYMALVLNEKYVGPGRYGTFIQQRFLRLYPTYLILLVAILVLDGATSLIWRQPFDSLKPWADHWDVLQPGSIVVLVAANLLVLGQDIVALLSLNTLTGHLGFFMPIDHALTAHMFFINRPSWSLSVEFFFYLVAPFIVCRGLGLQVSVLLASAALRWALGLHLNDEWTYTFFPPNLCFFIAGSLGYQFYRAWRPQLEGDWPGRAWAFGFFAVLVMTYTRLPLAHYLHYVLFPIVFFMVPALFAATRVNRFDRLVGELSYPFYLIHRHVLDYMAVLFNHKAQAFYGPACVALTALLAWLFFRFIETRTEHFRESLYRRAKSRHLVREDVPLANDVQPSELLR